MMAASTINIGANPNVVGSLKFEGSNDIGPQIEITLTKVQFGPGGAINLIGDEYGIINLEGRVLFTGGSFGTATHPDGSLVSPTVLAYYVGQGLVSWQPDGATGYVPLGNCNVFEFEQAVERLDHWEHMSGTRTMDFSPIVQQSATVRLELDEWTAPNLQMYLLDAAEVVIP